VLEPGMTFSVECPLYVHGVGAFNIEDAIVITESGYELLNVWQRDLIQVK
jgi:Xaa-Pro aminopeptidase